MGTLFTWLVWLALGLTLGFLSFEGAVACGLPCPVAVGLAASLTASGSIFAARFRSSRSWVDAAGGILALTLATGLDFANLSDTVQRRSAAAVGAAEVVVSVEGENVAWLRDELATAEKAWLDGRNLAEAERTQGAVSGKAGLGSTFDRLTAQAANLETVVRQKRTALSDAMTSSTKARETAAQVDHGRHLLATVPAWILFVGAGALELILAALGWSLGHGQAAAQRDTASESKPEPVSDKPEEAIPSAEPEDDEAKVIRLCPDEIRLLSRLSRRAYRVA